MLLESIDYHLESDNFADVTLLYILLQILSRALLITTFLFNVRGKLADVVIACGQQHH